MLSGESIAHVKHHWFPYFHNLEFRFHKGLVIGVMNCNTDTPVG